MVWERKGGGAESEITVHTQKIIYYRETIPYTSEPLLVECPSINPIIIGLAH